MSGNAMGNTDKQEIALIDLPEEVLLKILSFVDNKNDCCCLVSKEFYRLACDVGFILALSHRNYNQACSEIITAQRIKDLKLDGLDIDSSDNIQNNIQKFAPGLKQLSLWNCKISYENLWQYLSQTPKLEFLQIKETSVTSTGCRKNQNFDLELFRLKSVDIHIRGKKLWDLLLHIPRGVVKKLSMACNYQYLESSLEPVLSHQNRIEHLMIELSDWEINNWMPSFQPLKLKKLNLLAPCGINLQAAFVGQSQLQELQVKIGRNFGDNDLLNICTLRNLRSLKLDIEQSTATSEIFKTISKLPRLKQLMIKTKNLSPILLHLSSDHVKTLEHIVSLHDFDSSIPSNVWESVGRNVPNLKSLKLKISKPLASFQEIVEHCVNLENLEMTSTSSFSIASYGEFVNITVINLRIKSLNLDTRYVYDTAFIRNLSHKFPNVANLLLSSVLGFTDKDVLLFLECFKNVEKLELKNCKITNQTIEILARKEHQKKRVKLSDFEGISRAFIKENLQHNYMNIEFSSNSWTGRDSFTASNH